MKENRKNGFIYKNRFIIITLTLIVIGILLPIGIDCFVFGNSIESNLTNAEWAGFLGSYIGGIATILAVIITIWYTTKDNEEKQIRRDKEELERRKRSIKPHLETRCSYVNKEVELGENDRIFVFDKENCLNVHCCLEQTDKLAMKSKTIPYMFNYKIMNAGAGNAVDMMIQINGFAERLVVLQNETVNIYLKMNKADVAIKVKLTYSDIEALGKYEQVDSISLQGDNRGFAFLKGAIVEELIY